MSIAYRAIWADDRPDPTVGAMVVFAAWLRARGVTEPLPDEGSVRVVLGDRSGELRVRRAIAGGIEAVQAELVEVALSAAEHTTRLTVLDGPGPATVWVDQEHRGTDPAQRPSLRAPALARQLLGTAVDPRVGGIRLTSDPLRLPPRALGALLARSDRLLPIVVVVEDPTRGFTPAWRAGAAVAERLLGVAVTAVVRAEDTGPLSDRIDELTGERPGFEHGSIVVFLPNLDASGGRPERHHTVSPEGIDTPDRAAARVAAVLGATVAARSVPVEYEAVRRELRLGRNRTDAALLAMAEEEIARLSAECTELKLQLQRHGEDLLDLQADLEEAVIEASWLRNQLALVEWDRMGPTAIGGEPDPDRDGRAHGNPVDLAVEARSMREAVDLARSRLEGIVLPQAALRDIEHLDAQVNATSWGELTWRALRALHLYAVSGFDGDFKGWCLRGHHRWGWPATDKKLTMHESESVQQHRRWREQRRFPVDPAVDPSGSILMWAHIKVAEGGGPLAPRIYFHDDTRGSTGRVHVGFVGPHRYVENTRTN